MDIYELIEEAGNGDDLALKIVAVIIDDLNDRRGIKRELQACDLDVLTEMFTTLANKVRRLLPATT